MVYCVCKLGHYLLSYIYSRARAYVGEAESDKIKYIDVE